MGILDILSIFDWITPANALLHQGSRTDIRLDGADVGHIAKLLDRAGIKYYNPGSSVSGVWSLQVEDEDFLRADRIIRKELARY